LTGRIAFIAEGLEHEFVGKFIKSLANISSRTREYMEARAKDCYLTHGISTWLLEDHDPNYGSDSEWLARTTDGVYFLVLRDGWGPAPTMTFCPGYMTTEWSADYTAEFDKLLKRVGITPRIVNAVRRGPDGLVVEYL